MSWRARGPVIRAISLAACVLATAPIHAQVVGTTSAVNPSSTRSGRALIMGAQIIHDDRIRTDAKGSLQLLFIDRTSMSIGPSSDVVIDDYIFDTKANAGTMTVSLGKGLLRFIGGQITHVGESLIKTPAALIGIRGGSAQLSVGPNGTQAVFLGGNSPGAGLTVTTRATAGTPAKSITITTPGYSVTVSSTTTGPLQQSPAPVGTLAAQNTQLTSTPGTGQTGGASSATAARVVITSNVTPDPTTPVTTSSAATSPNASGSNSSSSSSSTTGGSNNQTVNSTTQAAQQSNQSTAAAATFTQSYGPAAFALSITRCCDPNNQTSAAPFLPVQFAPAGNTFLSDVLGYRNATSTDSSVPARGAYLQYGINITGAAAAQSSWFYVATGGFLDDRHGGLVQNGGYDGFERATAGSRVFLGSGPVSSPPGGVATDNNRLPISVTTDGVDYNGQTGQYDSTNQPGFNVGAGRQSYQFTQTEQTISPPTGLGTNRPDVTLNGYVGAIMRTRDINLGVNVGGPFIISNANNSPNDVSIQLNSATSRIQANFNVSRQSGAAVANIFDTGSFQFGALDPALRARGRYVDYDNFAARSATTSTGASTANDPIGTVNGAGLFQSEGAFVAIKPADARTIFSGIGNNTQFCQCDFTRWGFWSQQSDRPPATGNFRDNTSDLALWVAGQLPASSANVPTSGIATYFGHVVANIFNAGNQYVDAGNFKNVVNFGTGTGTVNVGGAGIGPGIDGSNYSGTVNFQADRRNFNGVLAGTVPGRSMDMTGSFFRGTAGPVGEMGGRVNITGPGGYLGSGIFAGKQQ